MVKHLGIIYAVAVSSGQKSFGAICSNQINPDSSSGDDDSVLKVDLDENSKLYASPGTRHEIYLKISISDSVDSAVHVHTSYREEFGGTGDNHRFHHHAEIVRKIDPRLVRNVAPNSTIDVTLTLDIPTYVTHASQTKITIMTRLQYVNASRQSSG